jgi:hypothetical protein
MTKEVLKIINNNPDSYTMIIKAHHKDLYDNVNKNYCGEKFGEKLYRYINKDITNLGKCKNCGKDTKFKSFIVGFTEYCCKKCSNISTACARSVTQKENSKKNHHLYFETKKCLICSKKFETYKFRKQKCCSAKCSGIYVASKPNRIKKIKKTKLEKYGSETYVNPDKARKTCFEKYGVDNVFKSPEIIQKIKETNLKKYGVEYIFQSDEIKNKIKETNLKKYGNEIASQSEIIKEKTKQSIIEKYGVDNVFKNENIKNKIYSTNIKKYGTKIPVNSDNYKEIVVNKILVSSYNRNKIRHQDNVDFLFSLEEFKGIDKEFIYKFKCKKCEDTFEDHMDGNGHPRCLKCNPLIIIGISNAEKEISDYIKELIGNDKVVENSRAIINGLELDIYIPHKNIAIEYDGLYWHGEKGGGKDKNYHLNKTKLCNEKGIKLIHIFEDEWMYKKDIVKNKLKYILCENTEKPIYARKCIIKEINDCSDFLNKNHIQGNCPASIKLGAFYKEELVGVITFGKRRVAMGKKSSMDGEYELLRFATSKKVTGIASKLLQYFIKNYIPTKIVTYADKRYSVGNLYEKIGFKKINESAPNYWYFKDGGTELWHRFNFRKDTLSKKLSNFDANLSEWENMKNNGYDRIWDCGNIVYEWLNK